MKLYQALPVIFITATACSDGVEPFSMAQGESIQFGVTELSAASRADVSALPDTFMLHNGTDTCNVTVEVTVTDMCDNGPIGRAAPAIGTDAIKAFTIYSFYYPSATASPRPFFSNEEAIRHETEWITSTLYYWPDTPGSTLDFWAMADIDAQGVTVTASQTGIDAMAIDYTVPQRASQQSDLMIATTERLNTPDVSVPLRFRHICSAVRFVFGNEMQPGTIKEITLSGIKSKGRYTTQWNDLTDATTFTIATDKTTSGNETSGDPIAHDYNTLMMIPQQLGDDAMLKILFEDNVTGNTRSLTASLAGNEWKQGTTTTYRIGITPEYKLEFTEPVETQDAHYVICNSAIRISGLAADKTWTLKAEASDGADVSVQLTADVNEFVKQGFWTDKEIVNGQTVTSKSARGTATVTSSGSGDFPLTVFLPENVSDADRTITLTLSVDGAPAEYTVTQQITQVPPLWNGDTGWEQIDDHLTGAYGFYYTAQIVYVYNNSSDLLTANRVRNMISNLVNQYNASSYVDYDSYTPSWGSRRFYVAIDYSKLSNIGSTASSSNDGHTNTIQLLNFGGSAISNTFEQALQQLKRIGTSNTPAFRRRVNDDPSEVPQEVEGSFINESQALTIVLTKNRYYLNKFTDSNTGLETSAPYIKEADIKWYLPAYGQFDGMPASSFSPGEFWSSTAFDDATQSYSGSGILTQRTTQLKIRVARDR